MNEGEPTTEQLQAVINFSRRWGELWKEKLNDVWCTGNYSREDDRARLQQVRNQFGPEWLEQQPKEYPL